MDKTFSHGWGHRKNLMTDSNFKVSNLFFHMRQVSHEEDCRLNLMPNRTSESTEDLVPSNSFDISYCPYLCLYYRADFIVSSVKFFPKKLTKKISEIFIHKKILIKSIGEIQRIHKKKAQK